MDGIHFACLLFKVISDIRRSLESHYKEYKEFYIDQTLMTKKTIKTVANNTTTTKSVFTGDYCKSKVKIGFGTRF